MSYAAFDKVATVQSHRAKTDRKSQGRIVHAYPHNSQRALCGANMRAEAHPLPDAIRCVVCTELATHKTFIAR